MNIAFSAKIRHYLTGMLWLVTASKSIAFMIVEGPCFGIIYKHCSATEGADKVQQAKINPGQTKVQFIFLWTVDMAYCVS